MPSIFIPPIYGPKTLTSVLPALALGQNISKCEQVGGVLGFYLGVRFLLTVTQLTGCLGQWGVDPGVQLTEPGLQPYLLHDCFY